MVKFTGTCDEAIALTQDRIHKWRKRQKLKASASSSCTQFFYRASCRNVRPGVRLEEA
jgi:hypothetical protein